MAQTDDETGEQRGDAKERAIFYKCNERSLEEEGQRCEYKAHKALSWEEVPHFCKEQHSRQSVSRTLCSFLNTGQGGTVYLGILDNGDVNGLHLTVYQKDHLLLSLESLMVRYKPQVLKHMYELRFVPVITEDAPEPTAVSHASRDRLRPHDIQTSKYCWCETQSISQLGTREVVQQYVVEIEVLPWDSTDPRNQPLNSTFMGLHPMFCNEEGICFIRRQGSNIRMTIRDVVDVTRQEVKNYYSLLSNTERL